MPKVSVNILTKNRKNLLIKAINSVLRQSFKDIEIIVVNDGSTDGTKEILENFKFQISNFKLINHQSSAGITLSRQEALIASKGEYVAILDDDDEWVEPEKLKKQIEFLDRHPEYVLVGGGVKISNIQYPISNFKTNPNPPTGGQIIKYRPETDGAIRNWMLLKNPFFTSTVMLRREAAIKAGGFIKDETDLAEDYDLWLRIGRLGKMYNFSEPFTLYAKPHYNIEKFKLFLTKQQSLIKKYKQAYKGYYISALIIKLRLIFNI